MTLKVIAFGLLWAVGMPNIQAQVSHVKNGGVPETRRAYVPASVRALPGLRCKLYVPGQQPAEGLTVLTDEDGYARFHAVAATRNSPVTTMTLACQSSDGRAYQYNVDLSDARTFARNPLDPSKLPGTDRPALSGDPLRYTQAELVKMGYGLRPDPSHDPAGYSRWLTGATQAARVLGVRSGGYPESALFKKKAASRAVTTETAPFWVGSVLTGSPDYVLVAGIFNVPTAIPSGDRTGITELAIWTGLGGFGTGSGLIQGGVALSTTPTAATYQTFREYCCGDSDSDNTGTQFTPSPGDQIYAENWYCDENGAPDMAGGYGCTYIHDFHGEVIIDCTAANGKPCRSAKALPLCSDNPKADNCMTLGKTAEFIIENQTPQVDPTGTAWTDFFPGVLISGEASSVSTQQTTYVETDPSVALLTDFTNASTHLEVSLGGVDGTYFNISPAYGLGATIWSYTGTRCNEDGCPGWTQLDNNTATFGIAAGGSHLYQLQNTGKIYEFTGTKCGLNDCTGWQKLDQNPAAVQIAANSSNMYQLHNTGKIYQYTGTACKGDSCVGWKQLDDNAATVEIAASDSGLYQLRNTGEIWRYTGSVWQMLDKNVATIQIAADQKNLYQLHNNGEIWRYTGSPCDAAGCAGWQRLDRNPATVQISADNSNLYQLHNTGKIWRYTGVACSGDSCPGWQLLDNNIEATAIAAGGQQLYELHTDGTMWRYTGSVCAGDSCSGWEQIDNNGLTGEIVAAGKLYQLHVDPLYEMQSDGSLWHYTGTPCNGNFCVGWAKLDNNPSAIAMTASNNKLYQLHSDGSIWQHDGTECNADTCSGWAELDRNPATVQIAAALGQLYQLHKDGSLWRYLGAGCNDKACPGWQQLDHNPATGAIAAGGKELVELHTDGSVWRSTGTPCSSDSSCPGWQRIDAGRAVTAVAVNGRDIFELQSDGSIWRYNGTPCASSCPGWEKLDSNAAATKIAVTSKELVQLHNDGSIWRYTGTPCQADGTCSGWEQIDSNPNSVDISTSATHIYQLHNDGSLWLFQPCTLTLCSGWIQLNNNAATVRMAAGGYN